LYIRALQLLSSALNLSKEELQAERLHPSHSVKQVRKGGGKHLFFRVIQVFLTIILFQVVAVLNQRFHHCLSQCKQLNGQSLAHQLGDSNAAQLTADKLLYNHAIDLVIIYFFLFGHWPSISPFSNLIFISSVNRLRWTSSLAIRQAVADVIKRRIFYFIVWRSK
jgi:hypothetical protein